MARPTQRMRTSLTLCAENGSHPRRRKTLRMLPFLAFPLLLLCCRRSWNTAFAEEGQSSEAANAIAWIPGVSMKEAGMFASVCAAGSVLIAMSYAANKRSLSKAPVRTLSMSSLNTAVVFKEVFLGYVSAIVLEPVINIVSNPDMPPKSFIVNLTMILAIMWWVYILTDAFDCSDVTQDKKYSGWQDVEKFNKWFKLPTLKRRNHSCTEKGIVHHYDAGLWFSLVCIAIAFCFDGVTHREVFHAWAMVFLWSLQHIFLQRATTWGAGVVPSFLLPSVSLLPIELCLPLQDVQDTIDTIEDLSDWRDFIQQCAQVQLEIIP